MPAVLGPTGAIIPACAAAQCPCALWQRAGENSSCRCTCPNSGSIGIRQRSDTACSTGRFIKSTWSAAAHPRARYICSRSDQRRQHSQLVSEGTVCKGESCVRSHPTGAQARQTDLTLPACNQSAAWPCTPRSSMQQHEQDMCMQAPCACKRTGTAEGHIVPVGEQVRMPGDRVGCAAQAARRGRHRTA